MLSIVDLMREADYWAKESKADMIVQDHVQKAIDAQTYRVDRIRDRVQEEILNNIILIDTSGERIGQINGLSVIGLGNFAFAQPSRITATVRLGDGEIVDIARETKLGGAIHSKGVLTLAAFFTARFGLNRRLAFSATLNFEQTYGKVEGDSASVAELCALMSVLADLPIRQSLAVTGSVNQLGQVQAIGGVNEKIEGFFDTCEARGLNGEQGVIIPASNKRHLMLKQEVIDAASEGRFHIYAVDSIEQAIELLTGVPAGKKDEQGKYPEQSVFYRIEQKLDALDKQRKKYEKEARGQHDGR